MTCLGELSKSHKNNPYHQHYYNCTWSDHGTLMKHISYPIVSDVTRVCTHTTAAWPWEIVNEAACCVSWCLLIGATVCMCITYTGQVSSNVQTTNVFMISDLEPGPGQ